MITQEKLKQVFNYSEDTGIFTYKERLIDNCESEGHRKSWNSQYSGKEAGTKTSHGYIVVSAYGERYYAHRLAWLYVYGVWPKYIDHIDGDGCNNKINNLRSVTQSENIKNTRIQDKSVSGVIGVTWDKSREKWIVKITSEGRVYNLGRYKDFFEAVCVRKSKEIQFGFHENHGRKYENY